MGLDISFVLAWNAIISDIMIRLFKSSYWCVIFECYFWTNDLLLYKQLGFNWKARCKCEVKKAYYG